MNKRNPLKSPSGILGNVVLLFVGLLLLLKPDFGSAAIAAIIGWGMIAISVLGIVICIASWPVCGLPELGLSIAGVIFGIILLVRPLALSSILGFCLGVILLFQCLRQFRSFRVLRQMGMGGTAQLILAVVTLILAIVLLVVPLTASRIVITILAVVMILYGIANLIFQFRSGGHDSGDPNIIDADE